MFSFQLFTKNKDKIQSGGDKTIILQLGDVIRLYDEEDDRVNNQSFLIDYIDNDKIKLIHTEDLTPLVLTINPEGYIGNGTLERISLLSRSEHAGYARQNDLLPGTWITLFFGGDVPAIVTAEITNLEEDMIEIKTYPDNETLYINFDFKGIPEDIGLETIEIRDPPFQNVEPNPEQEEIQDYSEEEPPQETDLAPPFEKVEKVVLDQPFSKRLDDIIFGEEELGPIVQTIDVPEERKRYSIETQTNDLLDDLLSSIPNLERTAKNINELHTMIERFKQLRQQFSLFDENQNIQSFVSKGAQWKPLVQELLHFQKKLYWILPVVKNKKKLYVDEHREEPEENEKEKENETSDIEILSLEDDIKAIKDIVQQYVSNHLPDEQNKYVNLYDELNPHFTPFLDTHESVLYEIPVKTDVLAVINNVGSFLSTVYDEKEKRFQLTSYNTGLTRLNESPSLSLNESHFFTERISLTPNDVLAVESILTLPEPMIRYSRVNLPGTSLLEKSNLNAVSLAYWKLLKENTAVKTTEIENTTEEQTVEFNFDVIQHFSLSKSEEQEPQPKMFLDKMIPKTKTLLQIMEKYIHGKLSVHHVLEYLEPFLIYADDLTFQQYVEMTQFIDGKISDYNKEFVDRERLFSVLKNTKHYYQFSPRVQAIYNNLEYALQDAVFEKYGYTPKKNEIDKTNAELLTQITLDDFGYLYNTATSLKNIQLMFSDNMMDLFEEEGEENKKTIDKEAQENQCKKYELAKKYNTIEELNADNNTDIYFDRQYDTTLYSLLDDYEKNMLSMSAEDFVAFLIEKLKSKLRLNDMDAEYLAETLVSGIKKVVEGQYAVLFRDDSDSDTGILKAEYYRRDNNQWVLDNTIDSSVFLNDSNLLCNIQEKCIETEAKNTTKCDSLPLNKANLVEKSWSSVFSEFDKSYEISKEALESKLKRAYEHYGELFDRWKKLKQTKRLQYTNQQYKLGIKMGDTMEDIVTSPYAKLLDVILGQGNFIKKQYDIMRFRNEYTREGMEGRLGPNGEEENEFWFYCKETNVKLLPAFLYELANVFINDNENYDQKVNILIGKIGKKSEDGDCWVDEHSGRVIKVIDFSVDEGYDEGFRVSTREVMERDLGIVTAENPAASKTETIEGRIILNIIDTLANNMGIQMDSQKEFIKRNAITAFSQSLPSETFYKKKIQELAKKGKVNQPSYKDLYNSTLLYMTLGMFLIAVQVNVPSIKSRRTFPGCVRSFTGYPIEGTGDDSSLQYLACIVKKIKSSVEPYNVLLKASEEFIAKKIRDVIQEPLWTMPDVVRKVQEKIEYLVENADQDTNTIPEEYNINRWRSFLPPLVLFQIASPSNITSEFKSGLKLDMDQGSSAQREKILVLESKMVLFSLALQERIQKIVYKKNLIMKNANQEPFVENACCNETRGMTALEYFIQEDGDIQTYNNTVKQVEEIWLDIRELTEAPFLFCRESSKNIYPPLSGDFNEETIYRAFIVFCHFNSLIPIHENLVPVCNDKPGFNVNKFSFKETVLKLKQEGRNYNNESLLRLLQIVNRNNRIEVQTDAYVENSGELIQDALTRISKMHPLPEEERDEKERDEEERDEKERDEKERDEKEDNETNTSSSVIPLDFMRTIQPLLETEDVKPDDVRSIKNFLSRANDEMRGEISEFIRKNHNMTGKKYRDPMILEQLFQWSHDETRQKTIYDEEGANAFQFTKAYIKNIGNVFPHIILNKNEYSDIAMRHWDLSQIHYNNINEMITEYYAELGAFYNNKSLEIILNAVNERCKSVLDLASLTPYFPEKSQDEEGALSVGRALSVGSSLSVGSNGALSVGSNGAFDKRMSGLLLEYYFLLVLNQYIQLSDNNQLFFDYSVQEDITVNDIFTSDTRRDERNKATLVSLDTEKDLTLDGNKKQLQKNVANLLFVFLQMMNQQKKTVDKSFDTIMDKVYRVKEREKEMVTDRLKAFTDEQRKVDTILKINKLGVWNKGLQKGLKKYVKTNYDDERAYIENLHQIEKNVRKNNPNANDDNMDLMMDDFLENMDVEREIENEVNDISDMNEDYTDGMYDPDDIDNRADVDDDLYLEEMDYE
jgi:hypothetical protein